MGISFANLLIILLIVMVFFGAGKLPKVMGDLGKGIKNFKNGLTDDVDQDEPNKLVENKQEKDKV
jgi:sec-independent protein translocase protein TatA